MKKTIISKQDYFLECYKENKRMEDGKQEIFLFLDEKSYNILLETLQGIDREMDPIILLNKGGFSHSLCKNDPSSRSPLKSL